MRHVPEINSTGRRRVLIYVVRGAILDGEVAFLESSPPMYGRHCPTICLGHNFPLSKKQYPETGTEVVKPFITTVPITLDATPPARPATLLSKG